MSSICFIAARGGSKGVPRKNIRLIAGKPLIAYSIQAALKSKLFKHLIVSTEDVEIAQIARKYGAEVPFMRPKKLASGKTGMGEVLLHGIKELYSLGYDFEILVNRDCTVPFIRNRDIAGAIKLLKRKKCDSVIGVYRQHLNPYFNMMEINSKGFLEMSKRIGERPKSRQAAPTVYQVNGLFVYDVKKFLKTKNSIPINSLPYEYPHERGIMIDTEIEFLTAEMIIKKKLLKTF